VQQLQGTYRVAVVGTDQRVQLRSVTVGPVIGREQVIEQGLQAGERVVVEGQQNAQPGVLVQVEPAQPAGTTLGSAAPAPAPEASAPDAASGRQGRTPPPSPGRAP